jgi:hypothetical protein
MSTPTDEHLFDLRTNSLKKTQITSESGKRKRYFQAARDAIPLEKKKEIARLFKAEISFLEGGTTDTRFLLIFFWILMCESEPLSADDVRRASLIAVHSCMDDYFCEEHLGILREIKCILQAKPKTTPERVLKYFIHRRMDCL